MSSLRKKKLPKKPKLRANKAVWDRYAKRKKEIEKHNSDVEKELERRRKI